MIVKKTLLMLLLTTALGTLTAFMPADKTISISKTTAVDGKYFFIIIDGVWNTDEVAFVSAPMYYPGYNECGSKADYDFYKVAKKAFGNYLDANYDTGKIKSGGAVHNMQIVENIVNSTSSKLTSQQKASDRMNSWEAEQENKGYTVTRTGFTYSCE